jgi:hypothetical protein
VSGGFSGYTEDKRLREEQERLARAEARQQDLDARAAEREELSLLSQLGYRVAPAVRAVDAVSAPARRPAAERMPEPTFTNQALGSAFAKAVARDVGGATPRQPSPLTAPVALPALESRPVAERAAPKRETRQATFRGQTFDLEAPESEAEKTERELATYRRRLGVEQEVEGQKTEQEREAKERQFAADVERLTKSGVSEAKAVQTLMLGGKYNDLFMSPDEQARLALERERLRLDQEKFGFEKTKPVAGAAAGAKKAAEGELVPLPSIVESVQYFSALKPGDIRKINPTGVMLANTGQQQGGFTEVGMVGGGSLAGVIGDQEKRYAQRAGAIADAVARASEVGVLTNFDINRFRSQIMFSPGDSEQLKQEKLNRARNWGIWLANNKKALDEGKLERISKTPESVSGYQLSAPGSNPYR